jgi:pyruvate dehydrogenase E1 component beta subunit
MAAAMRDALDEEMARDETVYVAGEDVGEHGGTGGETAGLLEKYGQERVRDTPILEIGIAGHALGAAVAGLRPVVEFWFAEAAATAGDELVNQISKQPYVSGGRLRAPLTIVAPSGGGVSGGAAHSQSVHAWTGHLSGIVVVTATTPYDAKGLLKSAIRDDNPVLFLPHKKLFDREGEVPDEEYTLPLGEATVERDGEDVTVVATQVMYHRAVEAADELAGEADVEIVNPRTFAPIDTDTIVASVEKTGRLVVVDETPLRYGTQGHVVSEVTERRFERLVAPPRTVGVPDTPIPYSPVLEAEAIPSTDRIVDEIRQVMAYPGT